MEGSRAGSALHAVVATCRKAPVTFSLFASYLVSHLVSKLWLDYRLFVALPGGPLPKNIFGWSIHYFLLSPLSLDTAWTSTRLARAFLPSTYNSLNTGAGADQLTTGVSLPPRGGLPPTCAGTIPHRQLDQFWSGPGDAESGTENPEALKHAHEAVVHILTRLQEQSQAKPSHLRCGPSLIESQSTALFAVSHTLVAASDGVSRSTRSAQFPSALSRRFLTNLSGEFIHLHCPSSQNSSETSDALWFDGSIHMTLHPHDAALVVERGWGVLHPLAGFPSYSGFWVGWPTWLARMLPSTTRSARWWSSSSIPTSRNAKVVKAVGLPPTYMLVYSPRDMREAKIIESIIDAAIAFAIGSRSSSQP